MALSRDVVIRLLGDASSAEKAIKSAADAAEVSVAAYRRAEREQTRQAAAAEAAAKKQMAAYESVGRGMMISGAVIAAGLGLAAKAAIDWESAWAGVEKTVDGTPEQMDELEGSLRRLATTLPATHEEIAAVAEAAGQLGIARGDIVEFTEVAIAMGVSTNLSAEDAAVGLARLSNIMGTSSQDVDRMGSALVALGNAGASTEGEILDMSLRIAAAGRQAGMSEGEVMGLANAMSSLGIEAEAGGTAISTVIKTIGNAVSDGGEELGKFARIAGVSSQQFSKAWKDDAAGALVTVVQGLARMQAQGENVNTVIADLGLDGIRTSDTLLRLAGDADGLAESLATGNKAWAENSALMNEANKRYETSASRIQIARNQISDMAIDIGAVLLPALASGVEIVANFARGFQDLPDWMQGAVTVIGVMAASVGLLGGAAIAAVPKIVAFRTVMQGMITPAGGAASAMGKFGLFMTGPWGAAIGAATLGIGVLVTALGASSRASEEAADYQRDLASALRESGGAIDDNVRALAAQQAEETKVGDSTLLEWAEKLGVEVPRVTDALLGNRDAYKEITGAIDGQIAALEQRASLLGQGSGAEAQNIQNQITRYRDLQDSFGELSNSMGGAVAENERLAAATAESGSAASGTTTSMDSLAEAQGDVASSGQDAKTAAEDLAEALDALNGPTLDMREASRNYQDILDKASESTREHGQTLDENTEAGRENADMLDAIAKSAMEQANAIAANGGSYDAFRNSLENSRGTLVQFAMDMGLTKEQAWALADSILVIPDAAMVDIGIPTYGQVTEQLDTVYAKVKGIPPQTSTNVGVISQPAIAALEGVGMKTRTLPNGEVEVYANTGAAEAELQRLTNTRRVMSVFVNAVAGSSFGNLLGIPPRASGGPVWPGQTFLVGEKGPELVQFGASGFVTPADQSAQVMSSMRAARPAATPSPAVGRGIPVGSAARAPGMTIDYARLAAAVASASGGGVHIGKIVTQRNETGDELAEHLTFLGRTRGG